MPAGGMLVFTCKNCNFRFSAEEEKPCPRCSSTDVRQFTQSRTERGGVSVVREDRPPDSSSASGGRPAGAPRVYGEGKAGWMAFHSSEQSKTCPGCGGDKFDLDYGKKERTCRKCGEILPLPRRFA